MKLLFDENLSRKLVPRIEDLFPESTHIRLRGMLQVPDYEVWTYARNNQFAIVTTAADFDKFVENESAPPKVIQLRGCNSPTTQAASLIRSQVNRIREFLDDPEQAVLILQA